MSPQELKEEFILMRAQGWSFDRIAIKLRKSKQTLINWSRELDEEIANLRAIELESLNERFFLSKQAKIAVFGEILQKIRNEIDSRDLSSVATDKLLDLFLRYHSTLEEEHIEPRFKTSAEVSSAKKDRADFDRLTEVVEIELKAV